MIIIGCDYHPGFQQIAWVNTETGELGERRQAVQLSQKRDKFSSPSTKGLSCLKNVSWLLESHANLLARTIISE